MNSAVTAPDNDTPLTFALGDDQRLLRDEVRRFAEEQIRPGVAERDRTHTFPREIIHELGELGILGMMVDEAYGGAGFDTLTYLVAIEELARVCPSTAVTVSVTNSVCCWPIDNFGSDDLKARVLPSLAAGEVIGGFCLTEPEAGSDAGSLRTTASRDGDHYVLNGEKAWITNAGEGKYFVVLARTDGGEGRKQITAFVVDAATPGFDVGTPEEKLGLKASRTAPVSFTDCRVPAGNLLGALGGGFKIALATLDHSRLGIAAQAVGIHQRALDLAIAYAQERVQFGVPIAKHQIIQFKLAQMATELEAGANADLPWSLGRGPWRWQCRSSGVPGQGLRQRGSQPSLFRVPTDSRWQRLLRGL